MSHSMSRSGFSGMTLLFKIRDWLVPRRKILDEVGIKPGWSILDFGCGPGSYSIAAAELVGPGGTVYALDILPYALEEVLKRATRKGLTNIRTIQSDCATGLDDNSLDVVLLTDVFHDLKQPDKVLAELHRTLKPEGLLAFNDHHLKEDEILAGVTRQGLFRLQRKGERIYIFVKTASR